LYLMIIDQMASELACLCADAEKLDDPKLFVQSFFKSYYQDNSAHATGIGCLLVNTVVELGEAEPALVQRALKYLNLAEQSLGLYFQAAQSKNLLNSHLDAMSLAKFFMNIKKGLMVSVRHGTPMDELHSVIETALCILEQP
jgi:hypothetical protein